MTKSEPPTIGFIGTGVMGRSMARHLLTAGYPLHVHNRTAAKAQDLIEAGATWAEDLQTLAAVSDVIISIIGFPADVEKVYLSADGLVNIARPGSLLIDMTTSSPQLAQEMARRARDRGIETLDAPVSGGDLGAREARLSIMVGGEPEAFARALPLFECMGKNIIHQGPAGSGQHTKMANQIAIAAGMLGVCEALAYAQNSGLDPSRVLESIGSGAAGSWSLNHLGPRIIENNFAPGFYVKHFIKDMRIAVDEAAALGLETPGLHLALERYEVLAADGGEDLGTHGLYKLYHKTDASGTTA